MYHSYYIITSFILSCAYIVDSNLPKCKLIHCYSLLVCIVNMSLVTATYNIYTSIDLNDFQ